MKTGNKIWFIGVNSSYIHTNPAIRILASKANANWIEFNINQHKDYVLKEIYNLQPDVAAFSCYIWNIDYIIETADNLKKILPEVKVLLGGPEVSYNARRMMNEHSFIDAVICGEGDDIINRVIRSLYSPTDCDFALTRRNGKIFGNDNFCNVENLDFADEPFKNYTYDVNKIYYYESSRGCPYNCAYCLSGNDVKLRFKSWEKIKNDLDLIAAQNIKLIKFTDRTFNADRARAYKIFKYIIESEQFKDCRFHFEIGVDLLDEQTLNLLANAPDGRIQFEAGIQTCNEYVLNLICRSTKLNEALKNSEYIIKNTKIKLHLDLIAGLPGENFESFKKSFNRVYNLYPNEIQLGFLKVLKGSRLRDDADKYGLVYRSKPPYEILKTYDMKPDEFHILKGVSELINRYYNTKRAGGALKYLTDNLGLNAFNLYENLYKYSIKSNPQNRPLSAHDQFRLLIDYAEIILSQNEYLDFLKLLKQDYLKVKIKGAMPKRLAKV